MAPRKPWWIILRPYGPFEPWFNSTSGPAT
jgi:hypothetical protein